MKLTPPVFTQDALLLQLVKQGCKHSFNTLYEKYWESAYDVACKHFKDRDAVKDVLQDIFTHIWLRRETLQVENLPAYLHVSVRNKMSKLAQKQKSIHPLFDNLKTMPAKSQWADSNLIFRELFSTYIIFLNTLSPKKQIIFRLRYVEDLSTKDIAMQLCISRKTIQNQLGKIDDQLRTVLLTA